MRDDFETSTLAFAEETMNLPLYKWQAKVLRPLERATGPGAELINIALAGPNGIGKDDRIIPVAAYWWLFMHKRGKVVITSKSANQLEEQTIVNLDKHFSKFGWAQPTHHPRYQLNTPTGGKLVAFVSNEAERVEGFHKEDDIDGPLLQIVNEAKTVGEPIFMGLDRHTVNARMYLSSTGLMMGRFYDCFSKHKANWITVHVGLEDCPHIDQKRIDFLKAMYPANHPVLRSILYGEFMEQGDDTVLCCTVGDWERCRMSPPRHLPGWRYCFWDFAEGRAENVCVLRDGNKYTVEDAFREGGEDAIVGRAIQTMRRLGFHAEEAQGNCGGDAAAKGILDKLSQAGWNLHRQNFGAPDKGGLYQSWSALAWIEGSNKIKNRAVILPDDDMTLAQTTTRPKLWLPSGKQAVMSKAQMKDELGLVSPDRSDAMFGAMAAIDLSQWASKTPFDVSGWRDKFDEAGDRKFLAGLGADAGL